MGKLRILHRVPLVGQRGGASLLFNQWIPENEASAITVERDGMRIAVSVDRTCVDSMHDDITDELISRWLNIRVVALLVEVVVADIPDDLGAFIVEKERWPKGEDIINSSNAATRELAERYAALGCKVMLAVLEVINRIVSWAYAEHGVYWLATREPTASRVSSNNNEFGARAMFSGSRVVRWCPPAADEPIELGVHSELSIHRSDWEALAGFVRSSRRTDAIGEILGNARLHLANGHTRGAVIEAVSALEAAVSRFMKSPKLDALRTDRVYARAKPTASLSKHLEHLGFTATVAHLLPLLLPSAVLTADLLSGACEAIQCRHNIVHNQQRSLDIPAASAHVRAASALIVVLRGATAEAP